MKHRNNTENIWVVVDEATGAYLGQIKNGDTINIVPGGSREAFAKYEEEFISINRGRAFVKVFSDVVPRLCKILRQPDLWLLFSLTPYIGYQTGILTRGGNFLSYSDIVDMFSESVSASTVKRSLSRLYEHGIIGKCFVKHKQIYVANPYIFQFGSRANKTLLSLFVGSGWNNAE